MPGSVAWPRVGEDRPKKVFALARAGAVANQSALFGLAAEPLERCSCAYTA